MVEYFGFRSQSCRPFILEKSRCNLPGALKNCRAMVPSFTLLLISVFLLFSLFSVSFSSPPPKKLFFYVSRCGWASSRCVCRRPGKRAGSAVRAALSQSIAAETVAPSVSDVGEGVVGRHGCAGGWVAFCDSNRGAIGCGNGRSCHCRRLLLWLMSWFPVGLPVGLRHVGGGAVDSVW